jgi:hypothetical protein
MHNIELKEEIIMASTGAGKVLVFTRRTLRPNACHD